MLARLPVSIAESRVDVACGGSLFVDCVVAPLCL